MSCAYHNIACSQLIPLLYPTAACLQQGLNSFQNTLHPCAFDESSLSIGRVKPLYSFHKQHVDYIVARMCQY